MFFIITANMFIFIKIIFILFNLLSFLKHLNHFYYIYPYLNFYLTIYSNVYYQNMFNKDI